MAQENEERQPDREPASPKQAAALGGDHEQEPEQDETKDTRVDTEQHSDAPGPFGTG